MQRIFNVEDDHATRRPGAKWQARLRICLGLLVLGAVQLAPAAPADDVAAVLDNFHRAAAEADLASYQAQMAPEMVFLGTDATERWQGQQFIDFARPYFESGQGWLYVVEQRHVGFSPAGDVAWFDEQLNNTKLGTCRGSGLLLRTPQGWKIQQYNLSMPVPNAMIAAVAGQIRGMDNAPEVAAPSAGSEAASVDEQAADRAGEEEQRCRKRHKTNRASNC